MSARDDVLARVRSALGRDLAIPDVPRAYRGAEHDADRPSTMLNLLVGRLEDYQAIVLRVDTDGIAEAVASGLGDAATIVAPPGLPDTWLPAGPGVVRDAGLDTDALDRLDAVVTGATVAVAETGTIVLDGSSDQGRRAITLVPDLHVCVVHADQVVGTVPKALARLEATRPQTWISGPSATSDIELNRVEGVHGPRTLVVVLVD